MNSDIQHFQKLLGAYKLNSPVSPDDQDFILKRRKSDLKALLKKKETYGVLFWMIVSLTVFLRKFGFKLTLLKGKALLCVTVAVVSSASVAGIYRAGRFVVHEIAKDEVYAGAVISSIAEDEMTSKGPSLGSLSEIKEYYHKLEEIHLDDGSIIVGAVVHQDKYSVRIHTIHGVLRIPLKKIEKVQIK